MGRQEDASEIDDEFVGANLGDSRRVQRLVKMGRALFVEPSASFPDAMRTEGNLEGAYRLLRNEAVSADGILAGHYEQTVERARSEDFVLAVHDTTLFEFSGEGKRAGLGPLRGKGQGYLAHVSLLVAAGEIRRPLGVLSLDTIVRKGRAKKRKARPAPEERESARWMKAVRTVESRLESRCSVVHVMDREGDSYDIFADLITSGHRFVIRNSRRRWLEGSDLCLADVLATPTETIVEREVALSARRKKKRTFLSKKVPLSAERTARLAITAQSFTFRRPIRSEHPSLTIDVNVVHVREIETHGDEEPVEWTLVTTEPVDSPQAVERIVDAYRARWVIEEYFKVIKTGCDYETRQLESFDTLINALAIFIPIAWQLLLLRTLARDEGEAPATDALPDTQVEVLVATSKGKVPANPSIRQALQGIANLGGHIKNNGRPGWIVLARGYKKLLAFEEAWIAATQRKVRTKSLRTRSKM